MEKNEITETVMRCFQDSFALARLSAREVFFRLALSVLAFCVLVGLLIVGLSFFFYGLASVLGEMLGREWLGYSATGGILLAVLFSVWKIKLIRDKKKVVRIKEDLAGAQEKLLVDIDLSAWVQKYPWRATGVAAATGFVVSSQFYSSSLSIFFAPFGSTIFGALEKPLAAFVQDLINIQNPSEMEESAAQV